MSRLILSLCSRRLLQCAKAVIGQHLMRWVDVRIQRTIDYNMNDGTHVVASADVCGIYGNGSSVEEAVEDFCMVIKTRLTNNLGGIYSQTSDFEFQERKFLGLEGYWNEDGVHILQKHRSTMYRRRRYIEECRTDCIGLVPFS